MFPKTMDKPTKRILFVLMFTIFMDFMGFLLIFPLFPALFTAKHSLLVAPGTSMSMRYFYYALALGLWPIGCFFGTAYLGALTDRIGRKKILIVCLSLVGISYLLMGFSVEINSLWLFMAARLLHGFFGGNYDVAQAAVADISKPEEKAKSMGLIAVAGSIGIVFGPVISAFTSNAHYIHWFNAITPFWLAALFAFINVAWITMILKETYKPKIKELLKFTKVFTSCMFIFTDKRVRRLGWVFFFLGMGWGFYIQSIPLVLQGVFHYSARMIGLFYLVLGVGFALSMQYLQPVLIKRFAIKNVYIICMFVVFVILFLSYLYNTLQIQWLAEFFITMGHICGYGCLLAMISNSVTEDEQGQVMGGIGAVGCLAFGIGPFCLPYLVAYSLWLPILVASVIYLCSGLVLLGHRKEN